MIIREIARRTGRGWPTMILLAFAFAVFQAGLVDNSLFMTESGNIEWWNDFATATYIPVLVISGYMALSFVVGHVIWSIGAPIAVIEAFAGRRQTTPWLGKIGLAVTVAAYIIASLLIFLFVDEGRFFLPSWPQLAGAAAVVVAFLVAAYFAERSPRPTTEQKAPTPWIVGVCAFVLLSGETAVDLVIRVLNIDTLLLIDWRGFVLQVVTLAALGLLIWIWSQRKSWGTMHILAVGGAALLARAVAAFFVEPFSDVSLHDKLIINTILFVAIAAIIFLAARSARKTAHKKKKLMR